MRLLILAVAAVLACAGPASARWLRAESADFVVYSDGDPVILKDYVARLEIFDALLRFRHGLPIGPPPTRKLDIYLVRDLKQLQITAPSIGANIEGYYSATVEDIFAVAIRQPGHENTVLQHEYTHHFMLQHFPRAYPAWLVEGYAEYFMTVSIQSEIVVVGKWGDRAQQLTFDDWLPLERVLGAGPAGLDARQGSMYYAQGWLLTHYFMSDPARYQQLQAYLQAVGEGADPVKEMEHITGMPLAAFQKKLADYLKGLLRYTEYRKTGFTDPQITITQLEPSADDLLLLNQRLKRDVVEAERAALVARIRTLAAARPGERLATLTLARAETRFGDRAAGEHLLQDFIAKSPDDVEALQLLASAKMADGKDEPDQQVARFREAGALLAHAFQVSPHDYRTIYLYVQTRRVERGFPSETSLASLQTAHTLAPQVGEISLNAANLMMARDHFPEAIELLKPLANDPHNPELAAVARPLLEEARRRAQAESTPPPAAPAQPH